ncbi:hypothetical protein ACR6C2_43680 [Streptomyces sp. INA 01156]
MTVRPPSALASLPASPDSRTEPPTAVTTVAATTWEGPAGEVRGTGRPQPERGHDAHGEQPAHHRDQGLRPAVAGGHPVKGGT